MKDKQLSSSKPCKDREEAVKLLESICSSAARVSNVHGSGPMLLSDIPESCRSTTTTNSKTGVILGIDEAGRGPVLGPMTYGCAFWNPNDEHLIPKGFTDSKQLDKNTRSSLFSSIQACPSMGFVLRVLHASEISRNMLRAEPYNLNAMSHDCAMDMIQAVLDAGVTIDTAYIDTVGIADSYKSKLEREFKKYNINFVVEKKADANYSPCSAASVIAKVARDSIVENWIWSEPGYEPEDGKNYGSGYPSDPTCKSWMDKNLSENVFCFPDFVRFSWGPAKSAVKEKGAKVEWKAEEEDENGERNDANQMKMNMFLQSVTKSKDFGQSRKRRRFDYFDNLKLSVVSEIVKM
mmetsp:Transcript_13992/g.26329  ORF Transcript_13992/g.26329 Transcript_13992/m.26329 type:complete len:350 (-) Transcript_13992:105-1154(-)